MGLFVFPSLVTRKTKTTLKHSQNERLGSCTKSMISTSTSDSLNGGKVTYCSKRSEYYGSMTRRWQIVISLHTDPNACFNIYCWKPAHRVLQFKCESCRTDSAVDCILELQDYPMSMIPVSDHISSAPQWFLTIFAYMASSRSAVLCKAHFHHTECILSSYSSFSNHAKLEPSVFVASNINSFQNSDYHTFSSVTGIGIACA